MKKPLLLGIILTVCVVIVAFVFSLGYPGGMISYWKFDDATAFDSADANDGIIYGPTATPGQVGGALSFDGVNDYVEVPDSDSLDITGPITLEAWIFREKANAWQGIIAKFSGKLNKRSYLLYVTSANKLALMISSTGLQAGSGWGSYIFGDSDIPLNEWAHVMGTYDGSYLRVYINGSFNGEEPATIDPTYVSDAPLRIGIFTQAGSQYPVLESLGFGGKIDEVAIYNRALSAIEVQQHYQDGLEGLGYEVECIDPPTGMVSWWPGDGDAVDIQGGNNGTLVNDAAFVDGKVEQAFSLDGFNDYVQVPASVSLNEVGKTGFTADAWVKLESGYPIITKHRQNKPNIEGWLLSAHENKFHLQLRANGFCCQTLTSTVDWVAGRWYHVAGTYNGIEARLYVDGVLESFLQVSGDTSSTIDINIGRDVNTEAHFLNGIVDEVEIFDRALSADEIQDIYLAGSAGKCKELINQPPVAVCKDITIDCPATTITVEMVDGGSYDPDEGDTFTLSIDKTVLPFGEHDVSLTITDENGASDTCQAKVTVVDTTPPIIGSFTVDPDVLRPPNHKMVRIYPTITVNDNCDSDPSIVYTITMDEGDETDTYDAIYDSTLGDGHTTNDFRVEENGEIYVRAERSGKGTGRTYTITCTATDVSGNSATATATVTVPHDQKK